MSKPEWVKGLRGRDETTEKPEWLRSAGALYPSRGESRMLQAPPPGRRRSRSRTTRRVQVPPEHHHPVSEPFEQTSLGSAGEPRSSGAAGLGLGSTEGLISVGAWAARAEIASFLRQGVSPSVVVAAIDSGVEEGPPLVGKGTLLATMNQKSLSLAGSGNRLCWEGGKGSEFSSDPRSAPVREPAWMNRGPQNRAPQHEQGDGGYSPGSADLPSLSLRFRKKAEAPPARSEAESEHGEDASSNSVDAAGPRPLADELVAHEELDGPAETPIPKSEEFLFRKRARAPDPWEIKPPEPEMPPKRSIGKGQGWIKTHKEQAQLEEYYKRCQGLFEQLVILDVQMELTSLAVCIAGIIDQEKFRLHTEPKSAATGLRYARLLQRLLDWYKEEHHEGSGPGVVSPTYVLQSIERMIANEVGFRTPQGLLYALEFFSVTFGFECLGASWRRCKRLADTYASKRPPRVGADFFQPEFLDLLEKVVIDSRARFSIFERLVAGRLRLCAQAAIRHDDLVHTPLSNVEWCRNRGEQVVRGVRAKAAKTKTGPRPWVASFLGVSNENDSWLSTFMSLVLSAHGKSWAVQGFFCPGEGSGGTFAAGPSTIQADADAVKKLLEKCRELGMDVPLSKEEVLRFRWHGCKATMPTYMQHFGVKKTVVRHAGAWAKKEDAMPDLYLRESQILVLQAQEQCLMRLRAGGRIQSLTGQGVGDADRPSFGAESGEFVSPEEHVAAEPLRSAPANCPAMAMEDLAQELMDPAANDKELLTAEQSAENYAEAQAASEAAGTDGSSEEDFDPEEDNTDFQASFLIGKKGKGKLHKCKAYCPDTPFCGTIGDLMQVKADEALAGDTSLCARCFGPSGEGQLCETMCGHVVSIKGNMHRCGRRCILGCEKLHGGADVREHFCLFHLKPEKPEEDDADEVRGK